MEFQVENTLYPVIVQRKKNKNTYIRVSSHLEIVVSTSYFTTNRQILDLLEKNRNSVEKMVYRQKLEKQKEEEFYYLGSIYDIIIVPTIEETTIDGSYIYTKSKKMLDSWYQKQMKSLFMEHLIKEYQKFEEKIPFPKLKIRKMKTRWGVCNKRDTSVTLNASLMRETVECLDYVIVHELSHLVHFDHSKAFWSTVDKYCPNYKEIRKKLKE